MEKHLAMKGITRARVVFTQPSWAISIYSGSSSASMGSTISAATKLSISLRPLKLNLARA